jgi:hypothetical protein
MTTTAIAGVESRHKSDHAIADVLKRSASAVEQRFYLLRHRTQQTRREVFDRMEVESSECQRKQSGVRLAMRPLRNKRWTDDDTERLKTVIANGTSVVRAEAIFECSIASIRQRARELGTPFPTTSEARKKYADSPSSLWRNY